MIMIMMQTAAYNRMYGETGHRQHCHHKVQHFALHLFPGNNPLARRILVVAGALY